MSSLDKPGQLGNFRDFPDYLDAIADKKTDSEPAESAAKREMRKMVEKNVAVKDRIQAFTTGRTGDATEPNQPRRRSLSRTISERMNVFESAMQEQQQQQAPRKADASRSAVAPRAMVFGSVSAYKLQRSQDGNLEPQTSLEMTTADAAPENDAHDPKVKSHAQWEEDVHVTFGEDPLGAGRKSSIGKYALTPMPSMDDKDGPQDSSGEEDEGLELQPSASLAELTADELSEEYQKIEHQIQRISQEIDEETLKVGHAQQLAAMHDNCIDTENNPNADASIEEVGKKDDEVHKTLQDFDDKLNMFDK